MSDFNIEEYQFVDPDIIEAIVQKSKIINFAVRIETKSTQSFFFRNDIIALALLNGGRVLSIMAYVHFMVYGGLSMTNSINVEEAYAEMDDQIYQDAPICHFKKMAYFVDGPNEWYECEHCGHAKVVVGEVGNG